MKRKYRDYLILAITTLVIVFITTRFDNVFGSNTDWLNQHTIIPDYFRQMYYKTGKLVPNLVFNYGAGENIFNLSYYGLLSPLILPSYLLPFLDMVTYMTIMDILVVIISGILFYNFLKNNKFNDDITLITSILFITAGPLIFHMHRHIMFVNYMPFLVMGLIGVDKYINDNKKILLILSTFLMIMTSYYYSVCGIIVLGIYFIYKYLNSNKEYFIKDLIKFICLIIVAIFMSGILLLPTIHTLLGGRVSSEKIGLIQLLIPNLGVHNIFCGTYSVGVSLIGLVALIYLFFTKKKNNMVLGTLISIVLFIPLFMYLLNGGLYLKAKVFIPFLPLISYLIAYFLTDLYNKKIDTTKFGLILMISTIIVFPFNMNRACIITLLIYSIFFLKYNKKYYKILIIFILVLSFSTQVIENIYEDMVSIDKYNEIFDKNIETTITNVLNNDTSFYRSNNLHYSTKTINKIYKYNYYTTNKYTSTYNGYYLDFIKKVFKSNSKDYNYFMVSSSNDIMFNTFFGVKYLYSDYDIGFYDKYNGMYKNDNVLPIIYATNHFISEKDFNKLEYPYNQDSLINNVITNNNNNTISSNVKKIDLNYKIISNDGVDIINKGNKIILKVNDKGNLHIKIDKLENKILFISLKGLQSNSCKEDNISMKINNVENILTCIKWPYPNENNIFNYAISDKEINDLNIELTKGIYTIDEVNTYILDYENVKNIKNNITEFNNISINNNVIKGNINIKDYSYIVTSIPYDKGFKIKVNNNYVDYEIVNKGFIGLPLEKGHYDIEISYESPLLYEGKILSSIGMSLFIVIILYDRINKKYKY
ncbi:MAG: YfhO family protein [Bacilli bacterium]|nr:YfhO family protein [Bacilli bacterium]